MNDIYLRRRSKVKLKEGSGNTPLNVLASLQKNLECFGFLLAREVIDHLEEMSPYQVDAFYQKLIKNIQTLVGAHREFKPMYPNFPEQVMLMSEAELYFNAIIHYWTQKLPDVEKSERDPLDEKPKLRIIRMGNREDFETIFTYLAKSKTPFSPQDREDVKWFISQYGMDIRRLLPEKIPCKENLAIIAAEMIRKPANAEALIGPHVKTATDVLRIAVAMSNGDVSIATACKFGKFRRAERALLLGWVERASNQTEDMLRWKERWVRLGERLHPGEYAKRFPQTATSFDIIRNDKPFESFNSQIERSLIQKEAKSVIELLKTRPGEFARRLDHLSRITVNPSEVIDQFREIAVKVSTPVLSQVLTHFSLRHDTSRLRVFFPKGSVAKVYAGEPLSVLSPEIANQLHSICETTLIERFAKLPALGKCYLDDRLKNYLVPFSQRSASKALRTLVRGSRLPLPECSTLRFFVWWKNGKSRVDIDLSAVMYDANYGYLNTLAYYNLKDYGAHHSGDIVDAPKGAAEFIDIDIARMIESKVRFVIMCLNSFTQQPYCDLPECFAGWMARQHPNSGEIFEAKTVVEKVDIAADTKICLPAIFDLEKREVIWADIALANYPRFPNNVHNSLGGVSLMLQALTQLKKTTLWTLFDLHIRARGERISEIEQAQNIFAADQGITPYELDKITSEYL